MKGIILALAGVLALSTHVATARPPLYRSPDGNTVTVELFNESSGSHSSFWTTASLNGDIGQDFLVDTGATGICVAQYVIDAMLHGSMAVGSTSPPLLTPADYRGRTLVGLANGRTVVRDKWNIRSVWVFGFELHNIDATSCGTGESLLGQGVLTRFKSWTMDNERGTITVIGPAR
jgi:predicted aspartyl protease